MWDSVSLYLPALLRGLRVTVELVVYSAALAFALSLIAGMGRLSRFTPVRLLTGAYVEFFRGTSLLVQLFWMYYVLPLPPFYLELPRMAVAVLAIALNFGAYGSEVVRGAILAVPRGQWEAAIALNMTKWQALRRVILPQAFRMMLPGFGNLSVELIKSTALVSLITIPDMTFQAQALRNFSGDTVTIYGLLLVLYFLLAFPVTRLVRWVEQRVSVGRA